jgi:hypothetical protein
LGGTQSIHADRSAFDLEGLSVGQRVGDLTVGGHQDAAEGRTRNAHPLGGLFLIEPFQVGQPDRFELIERENDLDQFARWNPCRMENGGDWRSGYPAATLWSGHGGSSHGDYDHMFKSIKDQLVY